MATPLPGQTPQRTSSISTPSNDRLLLSSPGGQPPPPIDRLNLDSHPAPNISSQSEPEGLTLLEAPLSGATLEHEGVGTSGRSEATPEPLDELEVRRMRERLHVMGLVKLVDGEEAIVPGQCAGEREKELAEMVLRLTRPSLSSLPGQVLEQSRTISELVQQLDLIAQRHHEQREFWEADSAGWARVVGALTTRRFADGTHRGDVLERDNINLISENRILKSKLQDQQTRIDSLEGELQMLRPLLLLRPTSPLRGTAVLPGGHSTPKARTGRPKDFGEFSDDELELHHSKKGHNPTKHATTGDARAEHLLLATRKLGKERIARLLPASGIPHLPVSKVSGLGVATPSLRPGFFSTLANPYSVGVPLPTALPSNYTLPNLQGFSTFSPSNGGFPVLTPQTPRATNTTGALATQIAPSTPSPTKPRSHSSMNPRQANPHPPSSPSKTPRKSVHSPPRGQGLARPSTPSHRAPPSTPPKPTDSTPSALDHLITASRILGDPTKRAGSPGTTIDGSPLQKRRRIDNRAAGQPVSHRSALAPGTPPATQSSAAGRTMSALDVLAEQAAVVIAQSPRKGPTEVPSDRDEESNVSSDESHDGGVPTRPKQPISPSPSSRKGRSQGFRGSGEDVGSEAFARSTDAIVARSRASSYAASPVGSSLHSPAPAPTSLAGDLDAESPTRV